MKKVTSLFLAVLLIVLMACGCAPTQPAATTQATATAQSGSAEQSGTQQTAAPSETQEDLPENFNAEGYPIVNEAITLRVMGEKHTHHADWASMYVFQTMQELTGIQLDFEMVTDAASYSEKKNLILASGDLPDFFYRGRLTNADVINNAAIGYIIPITDLIDKYAVNLKAVFAENPDAEKMHIFPDGEIYSIGQIGYASTQINNFWWINTLWLDSLGVSTPETMPELYTALKAIKEGDPNGNGDPTDEIPAVGGGNHAAMIEFLMGGFGLNSHGNKEFDLVDGVFTYSKSTETYKKTLQFVRTLYQDGLLDNEFFTKTQKECIAQISEGIVGSYFANNPDSFGVTADHYDDWVAMPVLRGEGYEGNIYYPVGAALNGTNCFAITCLNEYPEATIRWVDYFFGDEGNTMLHGGIEGETFVFNEDGSISYTELITNNPDGLTTNQAIGQYSPWPGGNIPRVMTAGLDPSPKNYEVSNKARELNKQFAGESVWAVILSLEETDAVSTISTDLTNYVAEMTAKMVTGDQEVDALWDEYIKTLDSIGLAEYLEVYEAAYQRWIS